ncbi:hypothetical protein JZ751_001021, partial [Albula glossodonta]
FNSFSLGLLGDEEELREIRLQHSLAWSRVGKRLRTVCLAGVSLTDSLRVWQRERLHGNGCRFALRRTEKRGRELGKGGNGGLHIRTAAPNPPSPNSVMKTRLDDPLPGITRYTRSVPNTHCHTYPRKYTALLSIYRHVVPLSPRQHSEKQRATLNPRPPAPKPPVPDLIGHTPRCAKNTYKHQERCQAKQRWTSAQRPLVRTESGSPVCCEGTAWGQAPPHTVGLSSRNRKRSTLLSADEMFGWTLIENAVAAWHLQRTANIRLTPRPHVAHKATARQAKATLHSQQGLNGPGPGACWDQGREQNVAKASKSKRAQKRYIWVKNVGHLSSTTSTGSARVAGWLLLSVTPDLGEAKDGGWGDEGRDI